MWKKQDLLISTTSSSPCNRERHNLQSTTFQEIKRIQKRGAWAKISCPTAFSPFGKWRSYQKSAKARKHTWNNSTSLPVLSLWKLSMLSRSRRVSDPAISPWYTAVYPEGYYVRPPWSERLSQSQHVLRGWVEQLSVNQNHCLLNPKRYQYHKSTD